MSLRKTKIFLRNGGKMKKVLLIGADGMLGGELRERLEKNYEVVRNDTSDFRYM